LAIIVLGSSEFAGASERCYDLINTWGAEGYPYDILYLSADLSATPMADMIANKENFHWALTAWLKNNSNSDSQIWIWIFGHGVGLFHQPPQFGIEESWQVHINATAELNSDEGQEITEALIGKDVDGNPNNNLWVGVDEGIYLTPPSGDEIVWDDDFSQWLTGINYRRMVIYVSTCRSGDSENETCFGGGFIDDLSAPRRIIISPTNETYYGFYNETTGLGWFDEAFMNALDIDNPAYYEACNCIDNDGNTSVLEAYLFAYDNDMARKAVRTQGGTIPDPFQGVYKWWRIMDESPWLDDGGNFMPTFKNLTDNPSPQELTWNHGMDNKDGTLARYTWSDYRRYAGKSADINDDGTVNAKDAALLGSAFNCQYLQTWTSTASIADINSDNAVNAKDAVILGRQFGDP
jgi:hypothetical protein